MVGSMCLGEYHHYVLFYFLQSCAAIWWRVCYQRGQTRLVYRIEPFFNWLVSVLKGVKTRRCSPVDDSPSTDDLHHFVQKKKK